MPRALPAALRTNLEEPYSDDFALIFLTIEHPDLDEPIRLVSDTVDYVLDGDTYIGCPFEFDLPSDSEDAPKGKVSVMNVDRQIGETIRELATPPTLTLEIYAAADFDQTVTPRVALGTPALAYRAPQLELRNASVDAIQASAEIVSWDYLQEPFPSLRATQGRLPGLFR